MARSPKNTSERRSTNAWTPASYPVTREILAMTWRSPIRSVSQRSDVVPPTAEKNRACRTCVADARHVGRNAWVRPESTSRRRAGASARTRAPVPPGKIGSENDTSLRRESVIVSAPQSRSTSFHFTALKRSSAVSATHWTDKSPPPVSLFATSITCWHTSIEYPTARPSSPLYENGRASVR